MRQAAVGLHEQDLAGKSQTTQCGIEGTDVPAAHRAEHGIHHGGAGPFIFHQFGIDVARGGDEACGKPAPQDLRNLALMLRVHVGVQQADRHGLDVRGGDAVGKCLDLGGIDRYFHGPVVIDPFVELKTPAAMDQGCRGFELQIV